MRRNQGFSLIEVMVSAVLVIIVMIGVTRAFTTQHQTYTVVDQVAEAQQNLRAVSDLIERDMRRAGYMVPPHAAVCGYDQTQGPDTLFVSNADAIRPVFGLEGAPLAVRPSLSQSFGAPVTGVGSGFNADGASFSFSVQRRWVDMASDGDDLKVNEGVIVVNRGDDESPVACGKIKGIAGNTLTVDFGDTSTGAVGFNADVVAVPALVYELVEGTGGAPNRLLRNGQLLASDVEDFQLTYFFDDGDLVVESGESYGTSDGTDRPWELTPVSSRPNFSTLREVGINIVTVTRSDDANTHYQIGAGQVTGNREADTLPRGDGRRRRVSSARVRIRNAT